MMSRSRHRPPSTKKKRDAAVATPTGAPGSLRVRALSYDYEPGYRIPPHHHDWHQLVYAISGVMTVRTPKGTFVVPARRAVWIPAPVTHAIDIAGRVAMRTLYFSPKAVTLRPL